MPVAINALRIALRVALTAAADASGFFICALSLASTAGRSFKKISTGVASFFLLQERQKNVETFREQYELSFNAHLNLVTIHPWVDGNGRAARLLMNYIQFCYHLFPAKIFKEDSADYILSLQQAQDDETNQPFLDFMAVQLKKSLSLEIQKYKASHNKGFSFMF